MWSEKVIISNPESQVIACAVDVIKTVCRPVRSLVSTVQPFDHLLERTEFSGDFIVVGKSNYLGDFKLEFLHQTRGRTAARQEDRHYSRQQ